MSPPVPYLDSSALVKLAVRERETTALRGFLRRRPRVFSSALARTEVVRAVRFGGDVRRARNVLQAVTLIQVDDEVLDAAALLEPLEMRSLDAIHLASALALGEELEVVVTYDRRMRQAAAEVGLPVASPA